MAHNAGLVRTVVSISHCGCDDPGSIPGLDILFSDSIEVLQCIIEV